MATFRKKIEAVIGSHNSSGNNTEANYLETLDDFLKQSAMAVIDVLPDGALMQDSIYSTINNASGLGTADKKILLVSRNGFGCVEVPLQLKAYMEASSGSLYEPTKRTPVYYIEGKVSAGGDLFVKPNPTGSETARVYHISYPSPLHSDTAITNFPDTAEYAVVLGASIRVLQSKINDLIHEDEDNEMAQVATQELGTLLQLYNDKITRLGGQPTMGVKDGAK
tara:strand:- start:1834 stop:2502 length:669 start_codon:yes stop_codon:yes gene_type:complete